MSTPLEPTCPHLFLGGRAADYCILNDEKQGVFSQHITSGLRLRSARKSTTKDRKRVALENMAINISLMARGVHPLLQLKRPGIGLVSLQVELDAHFAMLRHTFKYLARMIEIQLTTNLSPDERYQLIHNEGQGSQLGSFTSPDVQVQRLRKSYHSRVFKLVQYYQEYTSNHFKSSVSQKLVDYIEQFRPWLQSQMTNVLVEQPAYMPFMIAQAFASRVLADWLLLQGPHSVQRALGEIHAAERKVRAVACQFLAAQTLYQIAILNPEHTLFYMTLYKSLQQQRKAIETAGKSKDNTTSVIEIWDDGLSKLRHFIHHRDQHDALSASYRYQFKTVADYHWYCQFTEQRPELIVVAENTTIALRDIFARLGHENPNVAKIKKAGIRPLLRAALPSVRQKIQKDLRKELQWKEFVIQSKKTSEIEAETRRIQDVDFTMIPIPAGHFLMGALPGDRMAARDEKPRRKVTMEHSFWMGRYPVTQKLYQAVTGDNPSEFKGLDHPVEKVSWTDAILFCNMLSEKMGLEKVYQNPPRMTLRINWEQCNLFADKLVINRAANGYRLPTEQEWEYASKGQDNYLYAGSNELDSVGWYRDNSRKRTHPVGLKKPNSFGLYDMSGNVWEWCWNQADSSSHRIFRGGSWLYNAKNARVSRRSADFPGSRVFTLGFRIVRSG